MRKILLTSTGFDNENIKNKFLDLLDKDTRDVKVLFVITAANSPDAVRVLSYCLDDLMKCGITDNNIRVYDMHKLISKEELMVYDAIYVCGGSSEYLEERIKEVGFFKVLDEYVRDGGVYVGVSAGSVVVSGGCDSGIRLIDNVVDVHCDKKSDNGPITTNDFIYLTDNQAIYINDLEKIIFE